MYHPGIDLEGAVYKNHRSCWFLRMPSWPHRLMLTSPLTDPFSCRRGADRCAQPRWHSTISRKLWWFPPQRYLYSPIIAFFMFVMERVTQFVKNCFYLMEKIFVDVSLSAASTRVYDRPDFKRVSSLTADIMLLYFFHDRLRRLIAWHDNRRLRT